MPASSPRPILLLTRPRPASLAVWDALSTDLRAASDRVVSPLIDIVPLVATLDPGPARGLIFSSANAVRIAQAATPRRDLPCFCVGAATTAAAVAAGWSAEEMGETADALVAALRAREGVPGPLLHVRGRHARGAIARRLTGAGHTCAEIAIYDQRAQPPTPAAVSALMGVGPVIAPLYSPRTARIFAALKARAPLHVVALSAAVAAELTGLALASCTVADAPNAQAMIETIENVAARVCRVEGEQGAQ